MKLFARQQAEKFRQDEDSVKHWNDESYSNGIPSQNTGPFFRVAGFQ